MNMNFSSIIPGDVTTGKVSTNIHDFSINSKMIGTEPHLENIENYTTENSAKGINKINKRH